MNNLKELKESIIKYVEQLDEEKVIELSRAAIDEGIEPLALLEIINEGMNRVGKLYEQKDYFIADLIVAGLIFREVLTLDKMKAHFQNDCKKRMGKVVLGTVKGDIHDIGKDIFKGMLETNGFEVIDLGVDTPKEVFIESVEKEKPDIVGLSGALTYTIESMREVVNGFIEVGLRNQVKIIIGANHINEDICKYIGADGFANDASIGTKVCLGWMKRINKQGEANDEKSGIC
ncbi:cobalamin B12-binding domain-containing protein [Geosporobacter ferrireducens]|uniref:Cobalamin-binding protein n=1 Tax=Geosporobacter ferrireducens TaxID=1424294 RepID=A0A1D8GJ98_9FIRM|nr:cobalamin-dependent protein [Geosporobacter ferrireducens]AOT71005.1 cobalamin-binding protein [Geosporobacter ferrireducens]MTI53723.1 cobalamin-binding protein [Geosporobacter ferrireducens]